MTPEEIALCDAIVQRYIGDRNLSPDERAECDSIVRHHIGSRVTITHPHPHAGRQGVVKSLDKTVAGYMWLVEFDDRGGPGIGGEDGCYVQDPRHWRVHPKPRSK